MISANRINSLNKNYAMYRQKDINKDGQIDPQDNNQEYPEHDLVNIIKRHTNDYLLKYKKLDQPYQELIRTDIDQNGMISAEELQIADSITLGNSTQALTLINNKIKETTDQQLIEQYQNKIDNIYNYFGLPSTSANNRYDLLALEKNTLTEINNENIKKENNQYYSAKKLSNLFTTMASLSYLSIGKATSQEEYAERVFKTLNYLYHAIDLNKLNDNAQVLLGILLKQFMAKPSLDPEKLTAQGEYIRTQLPEINYLNNVLLKPNKSLYEKIISVNPAEFETADSTICFLAKALDQKILKKDDIALFLHVLFNKKFTYTTTTLYELLHPNDFFKKGKGVCDEWAYAFHYIIQKLNKKCNVNIEAELIIGERDANVMGHMFCLFKDIEGHWRAFQDSGIGNNYYTNQTEALLQIKNSGIYKSLYIFSKQDQPIQKKALLDTQQNNLLFYKIE